MTPQLGAVGIVVSDMARSLAFYRRIGIDIPPEADGEGHVQVPIVGDLSIAWDTDDVIRSFDPNWTTPSGGSGLGLAFACASPSEVDATYADVVGAGYEGHLEPWDAFWGQRCASVRDPDGHSVDLYAPLPGATS